MNTKNNRLIYMAAAAGLILLVPFIAMQLSSQVQWDGFDFLIAGLLLFGTVAVVELVLRMVKSRRNRLILIAIVLIGLLLVWAELAVGLFGTPFAGS